MAGRWAIVLAVLVLSACTTDVTAGRLDGRQFLSTTVAEAGADRPLVAGTRVRLGFEEGRLTASAGCNTMGGTFRIEDGRLLTADAAMTEIGCDPPRHAQDDWLFAFLGSRPTIRLTGNDLVLERGTTVMRLLDREVAEPDLPLVGTLWTVDSIVVGEVVSSVPAGAVATMVFSGDGFVAFTTGCNEGGARVVVEPDRLRLSEVTVTDRACPGPAGALEAAVLAVLGTDPLDYRIEAGTLTLAAGDRGLGLRGG